MSQEHIGNTDNKPDMIRGEQTKAALGENSSLLGIGFLASQVSVIVH